MIIPDAQSDIIATIECGWQIPTNPADRNVNKKTAKSSEMPPETAIRNITDVMRYGPEAVRRE